MSWIEKQKESLFNHEILRFLFYYLASVCFAPMFDCCVLSKESFHSLYSLYCWNDCILRACLSTKYQKICLNYFHFTRQWFIFLSDFPLKHEKCFNLVFTTFSSIFQKKFMRISFMGKIYIWSINCWKLQFNAFFVVIMKKSYFIFFRILTHTRITS